MVRARRQLLETGVYEPLRARLASFAPIGSLLDVGCGEGYFTEVLAAPAGAWRGAIDASALAARLAAGRDNTTEYAVADAFDLPVPTSSVDVVWSVFGPMVPAELRRVLRPAGTVVAVGPGPSHLWELKQAVLDRARPHSGLGPTGIKESMNVQRRQRLTFTMTLDREQTTSLLAMTPYGHRSNQVHGDGPRRVTADFVIVTASNDR